MLPEAAKGPLAVEKRLEAHWAFVPVVSPHTASLKKQKSVSVAFSPRNRRAQIFREPTLGQQKLPGLQVRGGLVPVGTRARLRADLPGAEWLRVPGSQGRPGILARWSLGLVGLLAVEISTSRPCSLLGSFVVGPTDETTPIRRLRNPTGLARWTEPFATCRLDS